MTGIDLPDVAARQRVIDAALVELTTRPIDAFTLQAVAVRAEMDVGVIRQVWPSATTLMTNALDQFFDRTVPIPDTGSLPGDLRDYARSYAALINSAMGKRMLNALMISPRTWDLTNTRATYLAERQAKVGAVVQRAVGRGECVTGTDPDRLIDLLCAGLAYIVLAYGRDVTDDDCAYVVDTLLNGITRNP
ncbi:MAG: TetR-like C-terminal domain-containing protein [Mycobacterium sp.]